MFSVITGFFGNIKNIVIVVVTTLVGFFLWNTNRQKENAEEALEDIKEDVIKSSANAKVEAVEDEKKEIAKELKTRIKVLKEKEETSIEDAESIKELERQLSRVDKDEKVTITI